MQKQIPKKKRVLVGMSGGVDSAVCAWLLKERGYEVFGVHFLMNGNSSVDKTKKIAEHLAVPLEIVDVSQEFDKKIVADFVQKYSQGETPNPCVICNRNLKFQKLLELAGEKGVGQVATGHYARIAERDGKYFLLKGQDQKKDQSYFLYRLAQRQLAQILLPLGELTKDKVKEFAKKQGIPVAQGESQDVCFFAKQQTLADFLTSHIQGHPGAIVDEKGVRLGTHRGIEFFTIGQRQGLNLGGKGPYYVFAKDNKKAVLHVTSRRDYPALLFSEIEIEHANWIGESPKENLKYMVKTRYQTVGSWGIVRKAKTAKKLQEKWQVFLQEPQWAVTKGQSLVVFDGEKVVGGGIIRRAV